MKMKQIFTAGVVGTIILASVSFGINSVSPVLANNNGAGLVVESNLFHNFSTWRKGKLKDLDSTYLLLKTRVKKEIDTNGNITSKYENSLIDVNGDEFVDLLITDVAKVPVTKKGDPKTYFEYQYFYALLLGTKDMNYEVKYRCVNVVNDIDASRTGFYGDCTRF